MAIQSTTQCETSLKASRQVDRQVAANGGELDEQWLTLDKHVDIEQETTETITSLHNSQPASEPASERQCGRGWGAELQGRLSQKHSKSIAN